MLWQAQPSYSTYSRHVFHFHKLAIYFGVVLGWQIAYQLTQGVDLLTVLQHHTFTALLAVFVLGAALVFAHLYSSTTVYTITNKRIVIRFGIAITMTVNLPFKCIKAASVKSYRDRSGHIPLELTASADRVSYFVMWPCVRPWDVLARHSRCCGL